MSRSQEATDKKVDPGLRAAISAIGTMAALARRLGIDRRSVWQWKRVPADRVVEVEGITGVPRETLRPDLYRQQGGPPHATQAAE